jgi:hypothetical protein
MQIRQWYCSWQWILLHFFLVIFITLEPSRAQEVPDEILSQAQKGLPAFLNKIPPGTLAEYGFAENDPLAQAYLSKPFKVYTITPTALLGARAGSRIRDLLEETKLWYFPVMINDQVRALLVVDYLQGQWQAVSLGYANLARGLGTVMQRWPRSRGFNPLLIAVFQANENLVLVPEENPNLVMSLGRPEQGLRMEEAARAMERLKPVVDKNIKQGH